MSIDLKKLKEIKQDCIDAAKVSEDREAKMFGYFADEAYHQWEEIIQALEEAKEIYSYLAGKEKCGVVVDLKQVVNEWLERFKEGEE